MAIKTKKVYACSSSATGQNESQLQPFGKNSSVSHLKY